MFGIYFTIIREWFKETKIEDFQLSFKWSLIIVPDKIMIIKKKCNLSIWLVEFYAFPCFSQLLLFTLWQEGKPWRILDLQQCLLLSLHFSQGRLNNKYIFGHTTAYVPWTTCLTSYDHILCLSQFLLTPRYIGVLWLQWNPRLLWMAYHQDGSLQQNKSC